MNQVEFSRRYKNARLLSGLLFAVVILLTVALAALAVHITRQTNSVVLVPSRVSDGMVARGAADIHYLEAIARDAVVTLYQLSPNTLSEGRILIERVTAASARDALLKAYEATALDIEERKLSTVFRVRRLQTDLNALTVDVTGEFATYVRDNFAEATTRTIRVSFGLEGASARIIGIAPVGES